MRLQCDVLKDLDLERIVGKMWVKNVVSKMSEFQKDQISLYLEQWTKDPAPAAAVRSNY